MNGVTAWQRYRHRLVRRGSAEMSPFVRALLIAWARGEAGLPRHRARGKPPAGSWTASRIAATLTDLTGTPVTAKMVEKAATKTVVPAGELSDRDMEIAVGVLRIAPNARLHELGPAASSPAEIPTRASGVIFPRASRVPETRVGAGPPDGPSLNSPELYGGDTDEGGIKARPAELVRMPKRIS